MYILLIVAMVISAITDYFYRKIPNLITFPLIIISLSYQIYLGNWKMSLIGFSVAFLIGFIGFAVSHLGAGDVKLMAGIGAAMGIYDFIDILLIATIVGLMYGLINFLYKSYKDKSLHDKWIKFKIGFLNFNILGKDSIVAFFKRNEKYPVPFGTCLAVGLIMVMII